MEATYRLRSAVIFGFGRTAFVTAYCCLAISASHSAEISRIGDYPYMGGKVPHFLLQGQINAGDASKVAPAIAVDEKLREGSNAVVSFDSPGGVLAEGIAIGEFLAKNLIATVIRKGEKCLSACEELWGLY